MWGKRLNIAKYKYCITLRTITSCIEVKTGYIKSHTVVTFTTLLAQRLILLNWKGPKSPSHTRWLKDVMYHLKLEKMKYSLRGNVREFYSTWGSFMDYFDEVSAVDWEEV